PILRTAEGIEIKLPTITLQANETGGVDLNDVLPAIAPQLMHKQNAFGTVAFRYKAINAGSIFAFSMVHRDGKPFVFHFDAEVPNPTFAAGSLESVWWLPQETTTSYLVLSNNGSEPASTFVEFSDALGTVVSRNVVLPPNQTRRINVREEIVSSKLTGSFG